MDAAARFAGEVLAHAVYSVCDGETLIPILASETKRGAKQFGRVALDDIAEAAAFARENLGTAGGVHAVAVWDGYVRNLDSTAKVDALFAEVAQFSRAGGSSLPEPVKYTLVARYRHAYDPEGFGLFPIRELTTSGLHPLPAELEMVFWQGVDDHPQGSKIWRDNKIHREPWP